MKTTLSIIIGAALCAAIAVGPSSHVARAGDEYDCNKAEKWVKRTTPYDEGKVRLHQRAVQERRMGGCGRVQVRHGSALS